MGEKGAKSNSHTDDAAREILLSLEELTGVYNKKMFGGYGFFSEYGMFGILDSKGKFFIKADGDLLSDLLASGSTKHSKMPYYNLNEDILKDHSRLIELVKRSIAIKK